MALAPRWSVPLPGVPSRLAIRGALAFAGDGTALELSSGAVAWKAALPFPASNPVALPGGVMFVSDTGESVVCDEKGTAQPLKKLASQGNLVAAGSERAWVSGGVSVLDGMKYREPMPLARVVELSAAGEKAVELPPKHSPVSLYASGDTVAVLCELTHSLEEDPSSAAVLVADGRIVLHREHAEVSAAGGGSALITALGDTSTWVDAKTGQPRGSFPAAPGNEERYAMSGDVLVSVNCVSGLVRRWSPEGKALWEASVKVKSAFWSMRIAVSGGACWVVGPGAKLEAFDLENGAALGTPKGVKLADNPVLTPFSDGVLIASAKPGSDGTLFCVTR